MTRVSVIIPTHRRPELLKEAMASVLAQRTPPLELIVVDDADDAETRRVVACMARNHTLPIRYVFNECGGVCHSRNLGARESLGEWLAFLDDDDIWSATYLAHAHEQLQKWPCDVVIAALLRHEAGRPPAKRLQTVGLNAGTILRQRASMTGSNLLIRRQTLLSVDGFDAEMTVFNDWDLLVRLVDAGVRYTVAPEAVAEWRDHAGPRIATPTARRAEGIERFLVRYRSRLSPSLRRDLETTALGIRRSHSRSPGKWLWLTARLARAHGPVRAMQRLAARGTSARRGDLHVADAGAGACLGAISRRQMHA